MQRLWSKYFGRFLRERKSSTTVEFAIVGAIYLTILFFVIQGGIFYIKVTVLDVATENAARAIILNGNPNTNVATPPITGAGFAALVASDSFGVLKAANIAVALQIVPPRSDNGSGGSYGFSTITPFNFSSGQTPPYNYTNPGVCPVNYKTTLADNGSDSSTLVGIAPTNGTITACTPTTTATTCISPGAVGYANGSNGEPVIIGGIADDGASSITAPYNQYGHSFVDTDYNDGTYTCYAGQDALLQVQYTDPTIIPLVGKYFGTIVSTLAFQIEPPPQ